MQPMRVSIPGLFCEEIPCYSEHPIAVILLVSTPYQWPLRVRSTKSAGSLEGSVCPFFPEHLTWWEAPLCADFCPVLSATHLFIFFTSLLGCSLMRRMWLISGEGVATGLHFLSGVGSKLLCSRECCVMQTYLNSNGPL